MPTKCDNSIARAEGTRQPRLSARTAAYDLGSMALAELRGTQMVNGIGGSGDFARNAYLSIFVSKSLAKSGAISSVVPMVSHVDHTEHDVDILVTEVGLADLRELAPRERARAIIANCVHPSYLAQMNDYFERALVLAGHTPHVLDEAFSWHLRRQTGGTMLDSAHLEEN